jgi:hypothetical protein
MNDPVKEMVRKVIEKGMKEKELLVAQFIAANPNVPIEYIELVEQRKDREVIFTVRIKQ